MTTISLAGLIGATAFALSSAPQAWQALRTGHARGMAAGTIALWLLGEAAMLIYALGRYAGDWVLLVNYGANLVLVGLVARYKWWPRA